MGDELNILKFGRCAKSLAKIDRAWQLVTGIEEKVKPNERFNHARHERQHGECGPTGANFKAKPKL